MTFLPDLRLRPDRRGPCEPGRLVRGVRRPERQARRPAHGRHGGVPLNLVSDDAAGNARSAQWDREQYIATMTQVMGDGSDDISFESTRTPVFLSPAMAVVFSDSTMTMDGETRQLRYADILVRRDGKWAFQTMIQGGWGDNL